MHTLPRVQAEKAYTERKCAFFLFVNKFAKVKKNRKIKQKT